jgi:hypothetical protein
VPRSLRGIATQNTGIEIFTTVRRSGLTFLKNEFIAAVEVVSTSFISYLNKRADGAFLRRIFIRIYVFGLIFHML